MLVRHIKRKQYTLTWLTFLLILTANVHAKPHQYQFDSACLTFNLGCNPPKIKPIPVKPTPIQRTNFIKDELVLTYPTGDNSINIKKIAKQYNLNPVKQTNLGSVKTGMLLAKTNGKNPLVLSKQISQKEKKVEAATNNTFQLATVSSRNTYSMYETGVRFVHKKTKGKGVSVCMIDTPVDITHPSLSNSLVDTYDLVEYSPGKPSSMFHGTAIAGILVSNNPYIGIAPQSRLLAVSAFTTTKKRPFVLQGTSSDVAEAIDVCIQHKVDIINLSFTGGKDSLIEKMVNQALKNGIIVVTASGNGGHTGSTIYPALIPGVVTATAVDSNKKLYRLANKGRFIDYAAPGVNILTIAPQGKYSVSTGTSLSSAHISAVIALLLSESKSLNAAIPVVKTLTDTAIDLGAPGRDQEYGYGLISASRALTRISK